MSANQNIVDRVVERLKTQPIGDLISEEDLFDIVKEAIPKTFFEPRKKLDSYGRVDATLPPLIIEVMSEVLRPFIKEAVEQWAKDNQQMMLEHWLKVSNDGLVKTMQRLQDEQATSLLRTVLKPMVDSYNQVAVQNGRPQIYL